MIIAKYNCFYYRIISRVLLYCITVCVIKTLVKDTESVHSNRDISAMENVRVINNNSTVFLLKLNPPMQGTARVRHVPV